MQVRPRELPLARSAGAHVSVVEIALVVCAAGMELESMDSLPLPIFLPFSARRRRYTGWISNLGIRALREMESLCPRT